MTSTNASVQAVAEEATAQAVSVAARTGVSVREVADPSALDAICELFAGIWRYDPANAPVTPELLRAMSKAGNYVAGAYDGATLVGASSGFFAAPADGSLHSHITGVAPLDQARNVGFALKLHQRAWALRRGTTGITWTFDPLVRRNGYFNLAKLGAVPTEYLADFYGPMHDQINGGDQTDRLLVRWRLADIDVRSVCQGDPRIINARDELAAGAAVALGIRTDNEPEVQTTDAQTILIAVPADVEQLRRDDSAKATRWRVALREALNEALAAGARITGFDRAGWYLVERETR